MTNNRGIYNFITIGNPDVFGEQSCATFSNKTTDLPAIITINIGGVTNYQIPSSPVTNGGTIQGSFILFGIQQTANSPIVFDSTVLPIRFPFGSTIIETDGNNILTKSGKDILISTTFLNSLAISHASDRKVLIAPTLTFDVIYADGTLNHCFFTMSIHVFGPIHSQTSDLIVAPLGHALQIQFKGGKPPFEYFVNDGLYFFSSNSRSVIIQDPDNIFSSTTSIRIYDAWYNIIQKMFENYILSLKAALPNPLPILFPNDMIALGIDTSTTDLGVILNYYASHICTLGKELPSDFNSAAFLPENYFADTGLQDTTSGTHTKVERALAAYLSDITLPIAPKNSDLIATQNLFFQFINNSQILFGRLSQSNMKDPEKILTLYHVVQPYVGTSDQAFANTYSQGLSAKLNSILHRQENIAVQQNLIAQASQSTLNTLLTELTTRFNHWSDGSAYNTRLLTLYNQYNINPSSYTQNGDGSVTIQTNYAQLGKWVTQTQTTYDNTILQYNAQIAADQNVLNAINAIVESDRAHLATIIRSADALFISDFQAIQIKLDAALAAWAPLERALVLHGINQRLTRIASFCSMLNTNSFQQSDMIPLFVPSNIAAQTVYFSDFIVFAVNSSYDQGSYVYQTQAISGTAEICRVDVSVSDDMFVYQTNQTRGTLSQVYVQQEILSNHSSTPSNNSDLINFLIINGTFQTYVAGNFIDPYSLQYHCNYAGYKLTWSDKHFSQTLRYNEFQPIPTSPLFNTGRAEPRNIKLSGILFRDFSDDITSNFIEFSDCHIALNYHGKVDRTIKTFPFTNQIQPGVLRIPVKKLLINKATLPEFIVLNSYCPLRIPITMLNLSVATYLKVVLQYNPKKTLSFNNLSASDGTVTISIPTPKTAGSYPVDIYLIDPTDRYAVSSDRQTLMFNPLVVSDYTYTNAGVLGIHFQLSLRFNTNHLVNATLVFDNVSIAGRMTQNNTSYNYVFQWAAPRIASDYNFLLTLAHPHYSDIFETRSNTISITQFIKNCAFSVPKAIVVSEETLPISLILNTSRSDINVSAQITLSASDNSITKSSDYTYNFELDVSNAISNRIVSLELSDIDYAVHNWVANINLFTAFAGDPFAQYSTIVTVKPLTVSLEPYAFLTENALIYDVLTNAAANSRIKRVPIQIVPYAVHIPTCTTSINFANTSVVLPLSDFTFLSDLSDHTFSANFVVNSAQSSTVTIRLIEVILAVDTLSDSYLTNESLSIHLSLQILNGSGSAQIQVTVDDVATTMIVSDTANKHSISMQITAPKIAGTYPVTVAVQDLFYNDYVTTKTIHLNVFSINLSNVTTSPHNLYVNKTFHLTFDVDTNRFPINLSYYILWNNSKLNKNFVNGHTSLQMTAPSTSATYPLTMYGCQPGHSDTLFESLNIPVNIFTPSTAGARRSVVAGSTIQLGVTTAYQTEMTYTWSQNTNTGTIVDTKAYPTIAIPSQATTYTVITQSTVYSDLVGSQSVYIDAEPYNLSDIVIFPHTPMTAGGYVTINWVITSKSDDINTTVITIGNVSDVFVHRGPNGSATLFTGPRAG